jgi:hypothetical protein
MRLQINVRHATRMDDLRNFNPTDSMDRVCDFPKAINMAIVVDSRHALINLASSIPCRSNLVGGSG